MEPASKASSRSFQIQRLLVPPGAVIHSRHQSSRGQRQGCPRPADRWNEFGLVLARTRGRPVCLVPDRSPRKQWNPSPPWDPLLPGIFFFERPANRSCSRLQMTVWRLATPRLPGTDLCGIWCLVTYFGGKAAAGLVLPWLRSPERGRSRVTPHSGECSDGEIICCRSPKAAAGEKSRVDFGVRLMRITGR